MNYTSVTWHDVEEQSSAEIEEELIESSQGEETVDESSIEDMRNTIRAIPLSQFNSVLSIAWESDDEHKSDVVLQKEAEKSLDSKEQYVEQGLKKNSNTYE